MCGICGKVNFAPEQSVDPSLIRNMLDTIRHRGPDDEGIYTDGHVALGHRRLSIIDLRSGHQPLSNEDGSIWIAFNGEIYNYRELRTFLLSKGHTFKTQTDTEVIVHLYEEFGPDCVEKLRGMFAFAIWDRNLRTLVLARDRVGIKPLYYCLTRNSLVFASEIKAILTDPAVRCRVDPESINRFLTFLYLPGEETLSEGICKLSPGWYLVVQNGRTKRRQYWDLRFPAPSRRLSLKKAEGELMDLLAEAVKLHMIADVPVGVLLSGGVDSSAVLSFAAELTDKPINSYTVGFSDSAVTDERPFARLAARTCGSRHHEMTITAADFWEFLPRFVWHMEEPVCEPPAVAMYYVSRLASQSVKVLLSGEGGDEAFAGYSNYRNLLWLERLKRMLPPLNGAAGRALLAANSFLHSPRLANYAPLINVPFPEYYYSRTSNPYRYRGGGLNALLCDDFIDAIDQTRAAEPVRRLFPVVKGQHTLAQMLYIDTKTWLPDDLLVKADKMTMANSLELRVPLLDHQVLEFAASLPPHYKVKGLTTKYIVKSALSHRIPRRILTRKKAGFPVPYESWIANELRDSIHEILTDRKTVQRGYLRKGAVEQVLNGDGYCEARSKAIFSLLTLELWHRAFLDGRSSNSSSAR
jgi:asparagine synthase (glutamine-hydrolysing)